MKQTWLTTFLDLSAGVPSADSLRRVAAALLPGPFRKVFVAWAQALAASTNGKLVAIDGKTARGSTNEAGGVLHVVRAWIKCALNESAGELFEQAVGPEESFLAGVPSQELVE